MQQIIRDEQSLFAMDRIFKEWETSRKKKQSHSRFRIHRSAKIKLALHNSKIFFCNSTYLKNGKFLPKKSKCYHAHEHEYLLYNVYNVYNALNFVKPQSSFYR